MSFGVFVRCGSIGTDNPYATDTWDVLSPPKRIFPFDLYSFIQMVSTLMSILHWRFGVILCQWWWRNAMTLKAKTDSNKRDHNGHNCNTRGNICYPRKAQHYFIYQLQMTKCVETNNVIYNIGSAFLNFETLI